LPDGQSGKFFAKGLDTIIAGLPVGQIAGPLFRDSDKIRQRSELMRCAMMQHG
jgi:hypothetical protein